MNAKLLFKTVFLIVILLLLVLMGLGNKQMIDFQLPPLLKKPIRQEAAIMYFAFFAIGLVAGTILTAGGGRKGSSSSKGKSDK